MVYYRFDKISNLIYKEEQKMKLMETSIPQTYSTEYETMVGPEVSPAEVECIFKSTIAATADFLRETKKKNQKTALSYLDQAGNFIMAAIVAYNKNEEEGQDNWNFYFTFDENDIKDVPENNRFNTNESHFHAAVTQRLLEHNLRCSEAVYISPMISMMARSLSSFLDQNAVPGEEVTLEEDGYFVASVTVDENNEPVKALLPDSEMKVLIKDDAATEKAA